MVRGHRRQQERQGKTNAALGATELVHFSKLDKVGERLLSNAANHLALSGRSLHRILRVARTIADLEGATAVADTHIREALAFRGLDQETQAQTRF